MKLLSGLLAVAAVGVASSYACAAVIPISAGTAAGSQGGGGFFTGATDSQPTTEPTVGDDPDYEAGAEFGFAGTNTRAAYIDFGVDFASVRIERVLLLLTQNGTEPNAVDNYWWSPDNSATFDSADGDKEAPDFNILDVPGDPDGDQQWVEVWSSVTPVTPAARYLIVQRPAASPYPGGNRSGEIVFLGTVPEPATLGLLAAGAGVMFLRRRA